MRGSTTLTPAPVSITVTPMPASAGTSTLMAPVACVQSVGTVTPPRRKRKSPIPLGKRRLNAVLERFEAIRESDKDVALELYLQSMDIGAAIRRDMENGHTSHPDGRVAKRVEMA